MAFDDSLSTDRDKVRSLVGDVETTEILPDDTYDALLSEFSDNVYLTAAEICDRIIARKAKDIDHSAANYGVQVSQIFEHYSRLAKMLRRKAGRAVGDIFVGGASIDKEDELADDSDYTQNQFTVGMDDR